MLGEEEPRDMRVILRKERKCRQALLHHHYWGYFTADTRRCLEEIPFGRLGRLLRGRSLGTKRKLSEAPFDCRDIPTAIL